MKQKYTTTLLVTILTLFMSFSIDAQIRIQKVDPVNNEITFKNYGATDVDLTGYRLCARFAYANISAGMVNTGDLNLSQNEEVIIDWSSIQESNSDLGIYIPGGSFSSAIAMVDFTQWGTGGNGRESVAVAKGIWTSGDFIELGSPYNYLGIVGNENGVTFWSRTLSVDSKEFENQIRLVENPSTDLLKVNLGTNKSNVTLRVINVIGKEVLKVNYSNINYIEAPVSNWKSGIYFVEITSNNLKTIKKFIKK